MTWTPQHPDWNMGTKDFHLAGLETEESKAAMPGAQTVLDVGSGSGFWADQLWDHRTSDVTKIDLHGDSHFSVLEGDILDIPFTDNSFDLVHARRVVTNVPSKKQLRALSELKRVSARWVVLVDTFRAQRSNINLARTQAGLSTLGSPNEGNGGLYLSDVHATLGNPINNIALGAAYYMWTRLTLPIITRKETSYNASELRRAYPAISKRQADLFGVHRMLVFNVSEE